MTATSSTDQPASAPLRGLSVVDMSTSYAGPTASMYLADLGADVVKVERPGTGDDARYWGPPFASGSSAWFASANRNKRSIAIDLRSADGRQVLHRLIERADVFIENLNPAKLDRLGLAPAETLARHGLTRFLADWDRVLAEAASPRSGAANRPTVAV